MFGVKMLKETVCCFFGHQDATGEIEDKLRQQIRYLIENKNARRFYVGNHGHFDYMVYKVLIEMKEEFPDIDYAVVLAYLPEHSANEYSYFDYKDALFPDGIEKVPKRARILWRNDWMLKQSDTVVCYVRHHFGGSGLMIEKAEKSKKRIINLAKNITSKFTG